MTDGRKSWLQFFENQDVPRPSTANDSCGDRDDETDSQADSRAGGNESPRGYNSDRDSESDSDNDSDRDSQCHNATDGVDCPGRQIRSTSTDTDSDDETQRNHALSQPISGSFCHCSCSDQLRRIESQIAEIYGLLHVTGQAFKRASLVFEKADSSDQHVSSDTF